MSNSAGPDCMPRHVAIIMDGNGRWATQRGLPRSAGHRQGVEALRRTVRAAADMGISVLTLYSFSTENWARPQAEVRFLLELLRRFIRTDVADLHKSNVRIMIIGDRDTVGEEVSNLMAAGLDGLIFNLPDAHDLESVASLSPLHPSEWEIGLGRARVLSPIGRDDAADRWVSGDFGPTTPMARQAALDCATCGFLMTIGGPLGQAFGVAF